MRNILTFTSSGGCGAKLAPGRLGALLAGLDLGEAEARLCRRYEDAALLDSPKPAMVQSTDVIGPCSGTPEVYGAAATVNALGDLYAKGARPRYGLMFLALPGQLALEQGIEIARGLVAKLHEAGALLVGGHTVESRELLAGLTVTGEIDEDSFRRNHGCRIGDRIICTKPGGLGVFVAAAKMNACGVLEPPLAPTHQRSYEHEITQLDSRAAVLADSSDVSAATDVSGFGLGGHLCEMLELSGVSGVIEMSKIPELPGSRARLVQGIVPENAERTYFHWQEALRVDCDVEMESVLFFFSPQTSGGLLMTVAADQADALTRELRAVGYPYAATLGEVVERRRELIHLRH